ncbi:LysR family transcriptional regulator [Achromobacter sp. AONIH1]|jgi:DNA-binding transcriptional LysR family regulator|uniref:LysR family transcriptional regulator n=1 Tax=Achromobacter sp. AONIH1 TaxID=1758194 RepID=UPI00131A0D49|nr:LysR family transcriptional regulator [Achromobacter sp. AONIH1]
MTIKLHHLQYLAAVAGRGSVRSAALTLRVSSTAVSRGLIDLENLAGLPLFQRGAAGMLLTDAGKALLTHARQVLGQLDAVDQTLATLRGGTTTRITIGVTPWVARVLLGPTLHLLIRRRPDVRFDIHELIGAEYSALRDGTLDMAIGVAPPSDVAEFTVRPLLDYSITVSCRPGHPLSNARELEELAGQDWVLIGEIEHHTPGVQRLWRRVLAASQPVRLHYARSAQVVGAIVRTTDMLTISPWPLIEAEKARILHPLTLREEIPEQTIALLTKHNFALSGAARDFIDCLMSVIEQGHNSEDPAIRRSFMAVTRSDH